jgi:hypothetical protein
MQSELGRAAKARELAEWFRAVAGDDAEFGALMGSTADVLEDMAEDEAQDVVPEIAPINVVVLPCGLPVATNDNARASRRRTRH